jgi:hypothetical protein
MRTLLLTYNEYMDSRKLPAGYGNARAAENLFQWLLVSSRNMRPTTSSVEH